MIFIGLAFLACVGVGACVALWATITLARGSAMLARDAIEWRAEGKRKRAAALDPETPP